MRAFSILMAIGLLAFLGCGANSPEQSKHSAPAPSPRAPEEAAPAQRQAAQADGAPPAAALPRKVIRTASIDLAVEDFDEAEQGLRQLLALHKEAYVAQAEVTGSAGSPRRGSWRIRVPVAEFDDFIAALVRLGIPRKNAIDSKDVSEEFYDLDARIKNQKVEEARLLNTWRNRLGSWTIFWWSNARSAAYVARSSVRRAVCGCWPT